MINEGKKELIESHLHIPDIIATKYATPGTNRYDEIHSTAMFALTKAADVWNGEGAFGAYAYQSALYAVMNEYRKDKSRKENVGNLSLDMENEDGNSLHCLVPQNREDAPSEQVLIDKTVVAHEVTVKNSELVPGQWAAQLRAACYDGVTPNDMTEIMKAVVKKAKAGDLNATKLLIDYLAGGKGGNISQTVIIQQEKK